MHGARGFDLDGRSGMLSRADVPVPVLFSCAPRFDRPIIENRRTAGHPIPLLVRLIRLFSWPNYTVADQSLEGWAVFCNDF